MSVYVIVLYITVNYCSNHFVLLFLMSFTDVHCVSVLALLSPTLSPWRVRERVWRELGELRLLHLLQDPDLIISMLGLLDASKVEVVLPVVNRGSGSASASTTTATAVAAVENGGVVDKAIDPATTSSSSNKATAVPVAGTVAPSGLSASSPTMLLVSKAIIDTLCSLRSEEDKDWLIASIGLYQVSSSIFMRSDRNSPIVVNVKQFRLLNELLENQKIPDWIVIGTLLAASYSLSQPCKGEDEKKSGDHTDIVVGIPLGQFLSDYHRNRILLNSTVTLSLKHLLFAIGFVQLPASRGEGEGEGEEERGCLLDIIRAARPHLLE